MTPIVLTEAEKEALDGAMFLLPIKTHCTCDECMTMRAEYAITLETLLARAGAEQESSNEHD